MFPSVVTDYSLNWSTELDFGTKHARYACYPFQGSKILKQLKHTTQQIVKIETRNCRGKIFYCSGVLINQYAFISCFVDA